MNKRSGNQFTMHFYLKLRTDGPRVVQKQKTNEDKITKDL